MLISHKHRFVFIHNPKVGGTTLNKFLTTHSEPDVYHKRGLVGGVVTDLTHYRVEQWSEELIRAYEDGYYFFGVVRNPYEKFLSAMSEHTFQHSDLVEKFGKPLEELLPVQLNRSVAVYDWRYTHFCPQSEYFCLDGRLLDINVFRLEDINEWWGELFLKLNLPTPPLENARPSWFRPKTLTEELTRLVNYIYRDDFHIFGYPLFGSELPPSTSSERVERLCSGYDLEPISSAEKQAKTYREEFGTPPVPAYMEYLKKRLLK